MKKIISILACVCILLSAMVFTASAADSANEIVLTVDSLALESNAYTAGTATVDGAEFEWIQLGNYGDGIQVRDKADKGTSMLWNTAAFGSAIKEIKFTYSDSKGTYDNPDAEIISFGNEAGTYAYSTTLSTVKGEKEYTITPDAQTYTFFKFEHDYSYTAYWKSITIVLAGAAEGGDEDVTPPVEEDKEPVTTITLVETPAADTAYKFGMIQPNVSETDIYYIDGAMSSYYMNTVTDVTAAVDVYLEEVEGGYNLYAMVDGAKKYINMVVSGTYVNGKFENAASTVYTFNAEKKVLIAVVNDDEYWIGTRNDKTYTTVGPVKTSYNGFYCQLYTVTVEEGDVPPATDGDEETEGFDPTGKTAAEIVDAAYALAPGAAFTNAATLTGVITSVDTEFSSQYNNVTVTIAVEGASADKPIKCFRLKGEGADLIAVGDKITVTGIIKNYQHSSGDTEVEFDAGCTLDAYVKGEGTVTPPVEEDNKEENKEETKEEVKTEFGVVNNPVAGTAYKFGMVQGNLKKTLYVTGQMDGFYMATTENKDEAADVYLEETTGGYYIYAMVNGAKKYMGIEEAMGSDGKTHINAVYSDTAKSVFTYNATVKTFVTKVGEKEYGFGTRNDREYKTVSPSSTEYTENFVCQFYGMTTVSGDKTSPSTSDSIGAVVAMSMAAAAVILYTSKKR